MGSKMKERGAAVQTTQSEEQTETHVPRLPADAFVRPRLQTRAPFSQEVSLLSLKLCPSQPSRLPSLSDHS